MKTNGFKCNLLTLVAAVFSTLNAIQSARAIESEVWISPNGPATTAAAGTPSAPFRCPDPISLDTVLTTVLTNNYLTIHLMGGTFLVSTNGINMRIGWKLRGAGIDNTIVQLSTTNTIGNPNGFSVIGGLPGQFVNNNTEVSDLTVDCNFQNTGANSYVAAVALGGSNVRISRVKAINWGTANSGECFVIVIAPPPSNTDATNCIIEDCIVTQPAPRLFAQGATAISVFTESGGLSRTNHISEAVIRDNLVMNVQAGNGLGNPSFFNAYNGGIISRNHAINLIGGTGVYRDTWNGHDIIIEENIFDNVASGVYFNMSGQTISGLIIKNNTIRPAEGGVGIDYYCNDTSSNSLVNNFIIKDNIIYPSQFATNITALGLAGSISVSVINNVLEHGGTNSGYYDVYIPYQDSPNPWSSGIRPVQLNNWLNNVNMAGTQLVEGSDSIWQPGNQDSIIFTATTPGWYRVLMGSGSAAAAVQIESSFWNNYTSDTEFWFRVNSYTTSTNTLGELGLTRRGSYYFPYSAQTPAARIVSDWPTSSAVYLDIYVSATTSALPVKITSRGLYRSRLLAAPQLITATPSTFLQMNF